MSVTTFHGYVEPVVDPDAATFWAGVAERKLLVPTCVNGHSFLPPLPCCPYCRSEQIEHPESSGRGTISSWIVVHRALDPAFRDDVPYVVAAVELAEGARIFARLVELDGVELRDQLPVTLTWIEPQGAPIWAFRPAGAAA
jgi:uncharacterized OB-fold protein